MTKDAAGDGTVGKALEILDHVASFRRPVRFSEVLETSPYPKATLYRFLQTLTNQRMLTYDAATQSYSLGLRLVRLAHGAWRQATLAPIARPFMDALSESLGETIHLAQLTEGQVLYVDKCNAAEPIEMFSQAGKVGPGYCTGVGKAMMAFLDDAGRELVLSQQAYHRYTSNTLTTADDLAQELDAIRDAGIAFDREEHEPGIICIATPILCQGRVAGGMSITTSTRRMSLDELTQYREPLQNTAAKIGKEAENWQFPIGM